LHHVLPPGIKPPSAEDDRLESWKEIAVYLKHSERTVRRWEATEGLPVHRHLHEQRGSVYAFRTELDAWREQRSQRPAGYPSTALIAETRPRNRKVFWILIPPLTAGSLLLAFWVRPARKTDPIPVPITSYQGNELDPAFSPDGSQIAFTWNGNRQDNYDIYVRPLGQDQPVRLTSDPAEELGPAWSPDGRTLAFLRLKAGNSIEVMAIPASGGPARVLAEFFYDPHTFVKFRTRFLAWRPGSRQLAVAGRNSAKEAHALWTVDDHGNKRRLTTPPTAVSMLGDLSPAYAPDGRALLFTRGNTRYTSELHLLPLTDDGMPAGDPKLVAPGMVSANTPVWVGEHQIVFHRFFQTGLWTLSLPDGRPAPLGFARWWAEMPAFSSHGNRLAYSAGGVESHIWNLDLAAPDRRRRAVASTHSEAVPAISPDGRRLAFSSSRSGNNEVWVSGLEGQNAVRLTALEGRSSGEPRWSPDGRWIVFESRKEGRSDVFAIRADGSAVRQLTTHPADDLSVNWSSDGAWVYFSSNRAGEWDVWKMHWETGREVRVTTGGGLGAAESADGRYLYYVKPQTSSGYGFLWRVPLQGGREELVLKKFQIAYRGFSVLDDVLYFISDDERSGGNALFVLQLGSGVITRITGLGKTFVASPEITPDRSRMFYMVAEEKGYDLVAVENFR
jgi:Tol biopolymer transport system component